MSHLLYFFHIRIKPLSRYSREFKTVQRYLDNGYDPKVLGYKVHLEEVFAVKTSEQSDDFANFKYVSRCSSLLSLQSGQKKFLYRSIRPRKLLWHGSRLCNYVGILNQGLRIAPAEAPVSGYMFGKGNSYFKFSNLNFFLLLNGDLRYLLCRPRSKVSSFLPRDFREPHSTPSFQRVIFMVAR